jgi:hypothetical protein
MVPKWSFMRHLNNLNTIKIVLYDLIYGGFVILTMLLLSLL